MFIEAKKLPGYTIRALSEGVLQTSKFIMDYQIPFKLSKTPTDFINFIHPYFSLSDNDKKSELLVRNALCKYVDLASTAKSLLTEVSRNKFYVDGIELVTGKVVLLKDQDVKSENGVYNVTVISEVKQEIIETVTTNYTEYTIVFSRASYTATELQGLTIFVNDGTVNKDLSWTQVSHDIVIGTTDIIFLNAPSFWEIFRNLVTTVHLKDIEFDNVQLEEWSANKNYKIDDRALLNGKIYLSVVENLSNHPRVFF